MVFAKKGISAIIATVLIILITVASITLVWTVVIPLISEDFGVETVGVGVDIVTKEGFSVYDPDADELYLQLKQTNHDSVEEVVLLLEFDGNSESLKLLAPGQGQTKVYKVTSLADKPSAISVAPVF